MGINSKTLGEIEDAKELENLKKLEAVFFVSGRFLSMEDLISFMDLNPMVLEELIGKLQERYDKSDSALEIVSKNNLWKMDVRPEYTHIINQLATGSSEFTKAEQETLAIIAFKHPIKQSVVIKIRGNKAYDHIKKFLDLGLIKSKKAGHTSELSLSDDFYDYFNLEGNPGKKIFDEIKKAEKEDDGNREESDENVNEESRED
jgi:segregation and condensation protein B